MDREFHFSLEEIDVIAREFSSSIQFGQTVVFSGGLGAGKTTFIRALVNALGSSDDVSSPTYVLQHEYAVTQRNRIEHWDLYRVTTLPEELEEPCNDNSLRLVEWGEKFVELFERAEHQVTIDMGALENTRVLRWRWTQKS